MKQKVILGISGGTDSFVAAILLQNQGYQVIGVTLDLWDFKDKTFIDEAKNLAKYLGIEHYVLNAHELFKEKVVNKFISSYFMAKTPSPCSVCNNHIKFELLKQKADELGIEKIATGHYVQIKEYNSHYYIYRGIDKIKDQSYFLWELSQEILKRTITPLGLITKEEVRQIASSKGFGRIAYKKESMGVCFLEGQNYIDFIKNYSNLQIEKVGVVYNEKGENIGEHKGLAYYTVGQKKDLNICSGVNLYVKSMDFDNNSIIAANKTALKTRELHLRDYIFVDKTEMLNSNIETNIRGYGLNPRGCSQIDILSEDRLSVKLEDTAWAVAPGQPVVFYVDDRLIGGGIAI